MGLKLELHARKTGQICLVKPHPSFVWASVSIPMASVTIICLAFTPAFCLRRHVFAPIKVWYGVPSISTLVETKQVVNNFFYLFSDSSVRLRSSTDLGEGAMLSNHNIAARIAMVPPFRKPVRRW